MLGDDGAPMVSEVFSIGPGDAETTIAKLRTQLRQWQQLNGELYLLAADATFGPSTA